jgi:DNA-binding Xre family transcriptional regulator
MTVINRVPELVAARFGGEDKINLSKVQEDIGLNYATVSKWVKGQVTTADFKVLDSWCDYLGVEPGEILVRVPNKAKSKK